MKKRKVWLLLPSAIFVACTTNTTVIQGGKGGGAACDADEECASGTCNGATGETSSSGSSGEGENGASFERGLIRPKGTCAAPVGSSGGSDAGSGSTDGGGVKCGENGMYCKNNVLRSCATDSVVEDCAKCKYVGSGSGAEYDTSCRDEAADCTTCNSEKPWTGPGCYFGGGPAVCK